jgi:hypothetical protein
METEVEGMIDGKGRGGKKEDGEAKVKYKRRERRGTQARESTRPDGGGESNQGKSQRRWAKRGAKQTMKDIKKTGVKKKKSVLSGVSAPLTTPVRLKTGISLAGTSTFR